MTDEVRKIKACGVLLVHGDPIHEFLLMRHKTRLDLPKGHMEPGESEIDTALRELKEETGVTAEQVELDPRFRFETSYDVWPKRFDHQLCHKTTVIYLGRLKSDDMEIEVSEHLGFEWHPWKPPHVIQPETIDPLLLQLASYLNNHQDRLPQS